MISRRSLLLAGVALPVAAHAQCVTDTPAVDACLGGVRITSPPGVTLDLSFMTPGTLDPRITFTRASTATYFDAAGTLQTAAVNAPRWDYNPSTHALNGLLIEEARTNLLLNSATLGTQSVAVTAQAYTLSFYGTGTVTKSGTATGALVGTGATQRVSQVFTPTAGTLTCTVTGTVTNAQLEAGTFATSPIVTTAASVTRAIDVCQMPPASMSWFTPPGGSWAAEFVDFGNLGGYARVLGYPAASGITPIAVDPTSRIVQYDGTVSQVTGNQIVIGAVAKASSAFGASIARECLNGGVVASSAATTGYATLATGGIAIMTPAATGSSDNVTGYIRRVRYWPRALTNSELQAVTT